MENQRAVTLLFIVGAILAGIFLNSLALEVVSYASLDDLEVGGLAKLSTLLGAVGGIVSLLVALRNEKATTFMDSVASELKKVTWPTREETTGNTGIVVGATLFFAALLAVYDFAWREITSLFLYTTG